MKLKQFIQQETVLTAAAVLAVVSAFFVPPDAQYLGYIDLRTLAILFSLMTVMAGLRRQGFFDGLGRALLSRTHSTFQLTLVLVGLCFFGSMFITNDVSLLTFVPFTFVVLSRLGADVRRALLIPVVCMQTIAANLGSMLTPIGNPQNLYLYGKSGMSIGGFVLLMQRLQQPRQAEDVVAVVMGQADGVHLHQVDSGPAGGSLGPLAAVEQEAVSSAFGHRRREGAVGQGHGGRCTQQCNGQHKVSPYHKKSRWL